MSFVGRFARGYAARFRITRICSAAPSPPARRGDPFGVQLGGDLAQARALGLHVSDERQYLGVSLNGVRFVAGRALGLSLGNARIS